MIRQDKLDDPAKSLKLLSDIMVQYADNKLLVHELFSARDAATKLVLKRPAAATKHKPTHEQTENDTKCAPGDDAEALDDEIPLPQPSFADVVHAEHASQSEQHEHVGCASEREEQPRKRPSSAPLVAKAPSAKRKRVSAASGNADNIPDDLFDLASTHFG